MCSEERGERGEGSNASARLCMFRHPILDVFGEWWCFSFALYLCGCCKFSMTHPCRCRAAGGGMSNAPPSHVLVALPLKKKKKKTLPPSSPHLSMQNEGTNRSAAWHVRQVMWMRWSEASFSPEEPLHLTGGGRERGRWGRRGKDGSFKQVWRWGSHRYQKSQKEE